MPIDSRAIDELGFYDPELSGEPGELRFAVRTARPQREDVPPLIGADFYCILVSRSGAEAHASAAEQRMIGEVARMGTLTAQIVFFFSNPLRPGTIDRIVLKWQGRTEVFMMQNGRWVAAKTRHGPEE
jgi:hypothetical protein